MSQRERECVCVREKNCHLLDYFMILVSVYALGQEIARMDDNLTHCHVRLFYAILGFNSLS